MKYAIYSETSTANISQSNSKTNPYSYNKEIIHLKVVFHHTIGWGRPMYHTFLCNIMYTKACICIEYAHIHSQIYAQMHWRRCPQVYTQSDLTIVYTTETKGNDNDKQLYNDQIYFNPI